MLVQVVAVIFTGTGVVALGHQFYSWWSEEKAEEERLSDARSQHAQQLKCNRADAEQRQRAQVVAVICTGTVVVALGYQFYSWWSEEKAEEERHSDARSQHAQQLKCNRADTEQRQRRLPVAEHSYSRSGRNNHDHLKVKHKTQRDAQAEVDRMRREGYEGSEKLNEYYNDERNGWYVGNKGWK